MGIVTPLKLNAFNLFMSLEKYSTPVLILDELRAKKNILAMLKKGNDANVDVRPHFKTHQSIKIGEWFEKAGVTGITVSSLVMAEYFADAGWKSITVAFPVSFLQANLINQLASNIELRILVTDTESVEKLDGLISSKVKAYIEVDPGYNRSGLPTNDYNKLNKLKKVIEDSANLEFYGFYTHAGHSYTCRSKSEINELTASITPLLRDLKKEFRAPICFGDTPICSTIESFDFTDEISPGNFVFYDWTQVEIGSCSHQEIAVAMSCPVVGKYAERNQLLIHGGAIHFSKDSFTDSSGVTQFGKVAELNENGIGTPIKGNFVKSLSQEHGIVQCTEDYFNSVSIGDSIAILPIHSCLTAEAMGIYQTVKGDQIEHMSRKQSNVFR
ncbi:MAG: alanine racemase [Balneola sp.]|nr:MAG: alanine racemase [Balneola sp.]